MKPITDIEVARKLPEKMPYNVKEVQGKDGIIRKSMVLRKLVAVEKDDKALLYFRDLDGRLMTIYYDTEGAYKSPM